MYAPWSGEKKGNWIKEDVEYMKIYSLVEYYILHLPPMYEGNCNQTVGAKEVILFIITSLICDLWVWALLVLKVKEKLRTPVWDAAVEVAVYWCSCVALQHPHHGNHSNSNKPPCITEMTSLWNRGSIQTSVREFILLYFYNRYMNLWNNLRPKADNIPL